MKNIELRKPAQNTHLYLNYNTMQKLNKKMEKKVIELVKQNKIIEAMSFVQKELLLGLRKSKEIVDQYRK